MLDDLLLLRGLFDLGKAVEACIRRKLGRHRALCTKKKECQLFKARLTLGGKDARPPIGIGEILAGESMFLEIIFEEQPGALGIGAGGEAVEEFFAFVYSGL